MVQDSIAYARIAGLHRTNRANEHLRNALEAQISHGMNASHETVGIEVDDRESTGAVLPVLRECADLHVTVARLPAIMRAEAGDLCSVPGIGNRIADALRWSVEERRCDYRPG